ncbi:dihydrofolate reductase family protein [Phytohabitans sp. LJ34]|uniref:dihydrofolate reductase family protein n=1 Tax=Phytohabitans sp. LJ34 TaxID=3452217 RepID=UPI003F8A7CEB
MAKMLYAATMSLDGFIAGHGGDMSWLKPYFGPDPEMDGLVHRIGALLVGRRTFEGDDPNKGTEHEGAFGGAWDGPTFVLTHRVPPEPVPGVTFVDDLGSAVAAAKEAAGDKYVNILGANVARECLDAGLLDEVLVSVAPVMLGDGTRLFERPGGDNVRLERISLTQGPLSTNIWTRVLPR